MANGHAHTVESQSGSGMGFFLGIILLIVFLFLFFYYGLPYIQQNAGTGGTQFNVPNQFDVNVKQN